MSLLETYFFRPSLILLNAVPPVEASSEDRSGEASEIFQLGGLPKIGSLSFVPMIDHVISTIPFLYLCLIIDD